MTSVKQIQQQLKEFDKKASESGTAEDIKTAWESATNNTMDDESANSFLRYYRDMKKSNRKIQRGGMAPLDAQTNPGLLVKSFGQFPTEAATDPQSIADMDVYFRSGFSRGCGTEDSSLTVPADMGSNQVGGKREIYTQNRKMRTQRNRKTVRSRRNHKKLNRKASRAHSRKAARKTYRRKQRGGNLLESISMRPALSTAPPGVMQLATLSHQAAQMPPSGNPTIPSWQYATTGKETLFDPSLISRIEDTFGGAKPPPWQTAS
jgi:hypothetical protein